ncbi:hypothetical protein ERO13_A02G170200v2 [Gossypium hirsutum]|uniref:Uncharacterized protein n=4 Tax=Gossypium TaxID=3633 RepID=A0A1U8MGZ0_GOSHI|nr:uncharacterized protein LOC107936569 [Gossypium hirsutum]KAB2094793.1 hypothetical protein ES319_A02G183800v1 [Gossypium barbadense]KAG4212506.1 hypothetical protein ERO13_A02G170200v2 [Gossypium hirsutum]TYH29173.1 hypothetical protein ES288_A02G203100v1 [Gossypium darwinii]TYI41017.1 hypothetical protein ES332_A02G204900v1 [Gossypium tomentosum]
MKMDSTILHSLASKSPPSTTPLFLQPASSPPSQPPCTHLFFPRHLPRLPKLHCTNSSTDNSSTTSGNDTPPPPPPPAEPIQIRFKRGSRRRRQLQEDGFGVQGQNMKTNKAAIEQPVPKKWEEMSMTEKALDLYVGEKGLLFWLNKFAYASIFIVIGAWILFRFVGPALNLYQLDSPPLAPTSMFKGS